MSAEQGLDARQPSRRLGDRGRTSARRTPVPAPKDGEVLVRNLWLSLDPYMRGRMNDAKSLRASASRSAR